MTRDFASIFAEVSGTPSTAGPVRLRAPSVWEAVDRAVRRAMQAPRMAPVSPAAPSQRLLGLGDDRSTPAVKRAFRRLALERHPDHGGTAAAFIELLDAYRDALALAAPN